MIYHVKTKQGEVKTPDLKLALLEIEANLKEGKKVTAYVTDSGTEGWLGKLIENTFPGDIRVGYGGTH